jgi:KaiC/GvpD/RAD55 family RecA-like ATPase
MWDTEAKEVERARELKTGKARSGNPELDWLLFGGIPFGTNALVYGPSSAGKEVLVNQFAAQGLWAGIPVIWVLTNESPEEIKKEMEPVLDDYGDYEELGLVRYVEFCSMGHGEGGIGEL